MSAKIIKSKYFEAEVDKHCNITTIHILRKKLNGDTDMFAYNLTEENRLELIEELKRVG